MRGKDGRQVPADLVVMAVGIRPSTTLAQQAGLRCSERPGGILVDDTMQPYDPRIDAVGECVDHRGSAYGWSRRCSRWPRSARRSRLGVLFGVALDRSLDDAAVATIEATGGIGSPRDVADDAARDELARHLLRYDDARRGHARRVLVRAMRWAPSRCAATGPWRAGCATTSKAGCR